MSANEVAEQAARAGMTRLSYGDDAMSISGGQESRQFTRQSPALRESALFSRLGIRQQHQLAECAHESASHSSISISSPATEVAARRFKRAPQTI